MVGLTTVGWTVVVVPLTLVDGTTIGYIEMGLNIIVLAPPLVLVFVVVVVVMLVLLVVVIVPAPGGKANEVFGFTTVVPVFVLVPVFVFVLVPVFVLVLVFVLVPVLVFVLVPVLVLVLVLVVVFVFVLVLVVVFVLVFVLVALVVFTTVVSMVILLFGYTTAPAGVSVAGPDPLRPPMTPNPNSNPRISPARPRRARRAQQMGPQQVFLTASSWTGAYLRVSTLLF